MALKLLNLTTQKKKEEKKKEKKKEEKIRKSCSNIERKKWSWHVSYLGLSL